MLSNAFRTRNCLNEGVATAANSNHCHRNHQFDNGKSRATIDSDHAKFGGLMMHERLYRQSLRA